MLKIQKNILLSIIEINNNIIIVNFKIIKLVNNKG